MSQEKQTAEEVKVKILLETLNKYGNFITIDDAFDLNAKVVVSESMEEYATLKLQEKHKDSAEIVDLLKSYCIKCEEQAKEIERLKGENDNNEEHF